MNEDAGIEALGLSVRAHNALKRNGINTVGELRKAFPRVIGFRGIGQRSFNEIADKFREWDNKAMHGGNNNVTV